MSSTQKIAPCLWFDSQAEEAAKFYCGVFTNSRIVKVSHYTKAGQEVHGRPPGSVLTVAFELDGRPFTALNGGPVFQFSEAISFQVMCDTQEEARLLLGETRRRRRQESSPVRLAQGQVRPFVAGHTDRSARDVDRPGYREGRAGDERDDADEEARHRRAEAGVRREVIRHAARAAASNWKTDGCV